LLVRPNGALLAGGPDEVVDKILRHSETLGGMVRLSFMMNVASLSRVKMMHAIDAIWCTRSACATRSGECDMNAQAARSSIRVPQAKLIVSSW
jgi:hypothetical protein